LPFFYLIKKKYFFSKKEKNRNSLANMVEMHPSGFPAQWDGKYPMLYVLERHFDASKGETAAKEGYTRYLELPFFSFVAQLRSQGVPMGPLQKNGSYPVMFTEEHVKKTREEYEKQKSLQEVVQGQQHQELCKETLLPATPAKRIKTSSKAEKERRARELEAENERALDEAYQKNMAQEKIDQAYEDSLGKALTFNFRTNTVQFLNNPHYLLPPFPPQSNGVQYLSDCVEQREYLVMRVVHQTIQVLRAFPNQELCSSHLYDSLMNIISQNGLSLDPTTGEADSFFQLPVLPSSSKSKDYNPKLAMAKFLHIVRLPLCATFSLRQLLHPAVFPAGYPTPSFPHVLYNQLAQKFYRSMSLRHLTLAIHSPDILSLFSTMSEFASLVKCIESLEWFIGEVEFDAHRSFFSAPPEGFLKDLSGDVYNKFLEHFIVQLTISDRLKIPMVPFLNKPGYITYESFSSSLIQKLETWRPLIKQLSDHVSTPSSIFYSSLKSDGTFSEPTQAPPPRDSLWSGKWSSNLEPGCVSPSDLLKNLFMCCLGAQTEMSPDCTCSYQEASEFTLRFFLHPQICNVWNKRFLSLQPREVPHPPQQRILTLSNVWKNVLQLPLQTSTSNVWKNSRVFCEQAFLRHVE